MHAHTETFDSERRLLIVVAITTVYMLAEVAGSLVTGSLALLADSGHLLGDVLGLAMALGAIRFARRPATAGKTYGFYRAEILAALINSAARGVCEVILYSPNHTSTLAAEPVTQIYKLIQVWTDRFRELGALDFVKYVFVFENKGEANTDQTPASDLK